VLTAGLQEQKSFAVGVGMSRRIHEVTLSSGSNRRHAGGILRCSSVTSQTHVCCVCNYTPARNTRSATTRGIRVIRFPRL